MLRLDTSHRATLRGQVKTSCLAWIDDGKIEGFYRLMAEHGVTPDEVKNSLGALREVYVKHEHTDRYTLMINNRAVVVTPSEYFANEVQGIIEKMLH